MRRAFATIAITLLAIALSAPAAQALKPDIYRPGPAPDHDVAGPCAFVVRGHDVVNNVLVRDYYDADGNLVRSGGAGLLIEELSRLDAQGDPVQTITANISGPGTFFFDDEGTTLVAQGPWLFAFLPEDGVVGHPNGLIWLTTGRWVWRIDDAGITLVSHTGTFMNVCDLLA